MKRTLPALILSAVAIMLMTGCMGLASVAKQLKGDQAFVTAEVKTIYGSGFLVRDGRYANGNTVSADGNVSSIQPVVTNIITQAAPPPPAMARAIPPRSKRNPTIEPVLTQ